MLMPTSPSSWTTTGRRQDDDDDESEPPELPTTDDNAEGVEGEGQNPKPNSDGVKTWTDGWVTAMGMRAGMVAKNARSTSEKYKV